MPAVDTQQVFKPPALPGLFALSASFSSHHFPLHIHDTCTMGVIVAGVNRFWNRGANHYATRNTICVVNPDEPHTGETCTEQGFSYFNLYVPDALFIEAGRAIGVSTVPRFNSQIISDKQSVRALLHLAGALTEPTSALLIEERWLALCALLLTRHTESTGNAQSFAAAPRQIQAARDLLDATADANLRLTDLADTIGLSTFQLVRAFTKHVGLPPHAYHLQRRIERARQLILTGVPLVEAAARSGFSDQAHLTRHFRRHYGITPGSLRASGRKNVQYPRR